MECLEHQALTDLGSHEAYGTTGESSCFCGLAPPLDMNRMEPMWSILEDKCLHLRSNSVEDIQRATTNLPLSYGGVFCTSTHTPIPPSASLCQKMDEQEPVSPGWVAVLGRGTLFTSGHVNTWIRWKHKGSVSIFWTLIVPISSVTWKKLVKCFLVINSSKYRNRKDLVKTKQWVPDASGNKGYGQFPRKWI